MYIVGQEQKTLDAPQTCNNKSLNSFFKHTINSNGNWAPPLNAENKLSNHNSFNTHNNIDNRNAIKKLGNLTNGYNKIESTNGVLPFIKQQSIEAASAASALGEETTAAEEQTSTLQVSDDPEEKTTSVNGTNTAKNLIEQSLSPINPKPNALTNEDLLSYIKEQDEYHTRELKKLKDQNEQILKLIREGNSNETLQCELECELECELSPPPVCLLIDHKPNSQKSLNNLQTDKSGEDKGTLYIWRPPSDVSSFKQTIDRKAEKLQNIAGTVPVIEYFSDYSMGLVDTLCRTFTNPFTNLLKNRKRKTTEAATDAEPPQQIKYRKVESRFPKYVYNAGDDAVVTQFLQPTTHSLNCTQQSLFASNLSAMDIPHAAPLSRNSLFETPVKETTLVSNTNYIDLDDFEDEIDEAPQFVRQYKLKQRANNIEATSSKQKIPTNGIDRAKPTYAQVLRQQSTDQDVGCVLGRREASPLSYQSRFPIEISAASAAASRSILLQNKQAKERDQYALLLQQMTGNGQNNENAPPRKGVVANKKDDYQNNRSVGASRKYLSPRRRPYMTTTTINLTNDDDSEDDDLVVTKVTPSLPKCSTVTMHSICLEDDEEDDIDECYIVDKTAEEKQSKKVVAKQLPKISPVNTMLERLETSSFARNDWLHLFNNRWSHQQQKRKEQILESNKLTAKVVEDRKAAETELQERMRRFQIYDSNFAVIDEFPTVDEEPEFVHLTEQHMKIINYSLYGNQNEVIVSKFNMNITRRDLNTLVGNNWLNDEVINFYMNLLTERSQEKSDLPRVYAMNTFFVPRLFQTGYSGVKRWTRKIDIFAHDIIPVPVHVGGVHWCMAIINLAKKSIKYYDSMGAPNPNVLRALAEYLQSESLDKRQQTIDINSFVIESVPNVPRQMNGSDCGVFSCMFAEYLTRNCEITFSQDHMEYFRQKMVLEIAQGKLLR